MNEVASKEIFKKLAGRISSGRETREKNKYVFANKHMVENVVIYFE